MSKIKNALWDELIQRQAAGDDDMPRPAKHGCPSCDGLGEWDEGPLMAQSSVQTSPEYRRVICTDCEGAGWLTEEQLSEWNEINGQFGVGA